MNRSGLLGLVRGVAAYFGANMISAQVVAGWKARDRKDNAGPGGANRVVFMPGDFDAGAGGPKPLPAGRISRNAPQNFPELTGDGRALAWWEYSATVSVWAVSIDRPQDEEAQIEAVEELLEQTVRAMHNAVDPATATPAGFGNILEWGDAAWTLPPKEQAFGRELCFGFTLLVPLLDQPYGIAFPSPVVNRVDDMHDPIPVPGA